MAELSSAGELQLDGLTNADVPAAAALSAAIGWNQDEADWRRLVALHPEGGVAARVAGRLVGTATLIGYPQAASGFRPSSAGGKAANRGSLAWLGMVISDPALRGQGIGSAVTDAALARWEAHWGTASGSVIGLDATEFGAPLYRRRGFESVASIERWAGELERPTTEGAAETSVSPAQPSDLAALRALDLAATGVDRSALLNYLAAEPSATMVVAKRAVDELVGYAVLRSGREYRRIGPLLVAPGHDSLGPLLDSLRVAAAGSPVFLDAVRGAVDPKRLAERGLSVARTLQRMTRPAVPVFSGASVVAAMGFEWG